MLAYEYPFTLGSKVPQSIYIDVTNVCNLKCMMCPQGHNKVINKGFMSKNVFYKILSDVSVLEPKPKIAYHLIGEPFLHKDIFEFVQSAHLRWLYTFLHTNGTLLNKENCRRIVESGLDEITFSFEGENPGFYMKIRRGGDWYRITKAIQYLLSLPGHPKVIIEVLKFRGIDTSLRIDDNFKSRFRGARFYSYYASDWHGTLDDKHLKEERMVNDVHVCPLPLNDMAIGWDGLVKVCSIDYNTEYCLGDTKEESIMEIWLGKKRKEFLETIAQKRYGSIGLCHNCNAPYYAHKKERLLV